MSPVSPMPVKQELGPRMVDLELVRAVPQRASLTTPPGPDMRA